MDGEPLTSKNDLPDLVSKKEPGDEVSLEILRDGERRTVTVELAERPSRPVPG